MMNSSEIVLGYDYDEWYGYGRKKKIVTDISSKTNSHIILCGMSGSGKSYGVNMLLAKICSLEKSGSRIFFSDFKQDDQFAYLRNNSFYYPYDRTVEALDQVYEILHKRQSGEDLSRNPVSLIWDEYMANILALQNISKKRLTR